MTVFTATVAEVNWLVSLCLAVREINTPDVRSDRKDPTDAG
jgi:hypothetical protein